MALRMYWWNFILKDADLVWLRKERKVLEMFRCDVYVYLRPGELPRGWCVFSARVNDAVR